jgi:hypothetical protein
MSHALLSMASDMFKSTSGREHWSPRRSKLSFAIPIWKALVHFLAQTLCSLGYIKIFAGECEGIFSLFPPTALKEMKDSAGLATLLCSRPLQFSFTVVTD